MRKVLALAVRSSSSAPPPSPTPGGLSPGLERLMQDKKGS